MMGEPSLSVVLSTRGNYDVLRRVLDGYSAQDASADAFEMLVAMDSADPDPAAVDGFRNFLEAIGTAQFGEIVGNLDSSATALYGDAFAAGVQYAVFFAGVTALVGAALVWFAMPRSQPVTSIWDTRDEREVASEAVA